MSSCLPIILSDFSKEPFQNALKGPREFFTAGREFMNQFPFDPAFNMNGFLKGLIQHTIKSSDTIDMIYRQSGAFIDKKKVDDNVNYLLKLRLPVYLAVGFIEKSNSINIKKESISNTCQLGNTLKNRNKKTSFSNKAYKVRPFSISPYFGTSGEYYGLIMHIGRMTKIQKIKKLFSKNKDYSGMENDKRIKAQIDEIQSTFKQTKYFFIPYSFLENIDKLAITESSNQTKPSSLGTEPDNNQTTNPEQKNNNQTANLKQVNIQIGGDESSCPITYSKIENILCKCKSPETVIKERKNKQTITYYQDKNECIIGEIDKRETRYTDCLKKSGKDFCDFEKYYDKESYKKQDLCIQSGIIPDHCVKAIYSSGNPLSIRQGTNQVKPDPFLLKPKGIETVNNQEIQKLRSNIQTKNQKLIKLQQQINYQKQQMNLQVKPQPQLQPQPQPQSQQEQEKVQNYILDPTRKLVCAKSVRLPLLSIKAIKNNILPNIEKLMNKAVLRRMKQVINYDSNLSLKASIFRKVYLHEKYAYITGITSNPNEVSFATLLQTLHQRIKSVIQVPLEEAKVNELYGLIKGLDLQGTLKEVSYESKSRLALYVMLQIGALTSFALLIGFTGGAATLFSGVAGTAWIGFSQDIKSWLGVKQTRKQSMFNRNN